MTAGAVIPALPCENAFWLGPDGWFRAKRATTQSLGRLVRPSVTRHPDR